MNLKQKLEEFIPPAYYSNGTESKCLRYKILNMLDIDPQSYKEVKEERNMDNEITNKGDLELIGSD